MRRSCGEASKATSCRVAACLMCALGHGISQRSNEARIFEETKFLKETEPSATTAKGHEKVVTLPMLGMSEGNYLATKHSCNAGLRGPQSARYVGKRSLHATAQGLGHWSSQLHQAAPVGVAKALYRSLLHRAKISYFVRADVRGPCRGSEETS